MQKLLTFFQQNISIYAIFNGQSFIDMLTNDIVSFEQLGPGLEQSPVSDQKNVSTMKETCKPFFSPDVSYRF